MFPRAVIVVQLYSCMGPAVLVGQLRYWLWCESAAVLSIWTRYPRAVEVVHLSSCTGSVNLEDVSLCSRSSTAVQPYGASWTGGTADVYRSGECLLVQSYYSPVVVE
eukprot:COSAG01_NODE_6221_length_3782_cov_375.524029_6_plen_107_part_00